VPEIPKLSVVMPTYNEMATIEEILWRVQAIAIDKEIIIDDGSKDGTRDFLNATPKSYRRGHRICVAGALRAAIEG
jgi:glycosyltransferase involved in cell wall biosynthesis